MRNPPDNSARIGIHWELGDPPGALEEPVLVAALDSFLNHLGQPQAALSVLFSDDTHLRELNRQYRGIDRATDVLSWSYDENPAPGDLWGEMAISLERARSQAAENGWGLLTEVLRLLAHGCAHLAGHDHEAQEQERVMKALEIELLAGVGLQEIYPPDV